jgi:hypothetical protein
VEEGLELLARRNGSDPNPGIDVWDALDPDDARNQPGGADDGEDAGDGESRLGRDVRPQVGSSPGL